MILHHIDDWDNAYANSANIAGGDGWPALWVSPAQAYRDAMLAANRAELDLAYGDRPRNRMDLFLPAQAPKGLVVFVHGGFWHRLDKSFWSHLAQGAVDSGYAVVMPSYTLCPEVRIADITVEIGRAIEVAAARIDGPIYLTGHSAGGHLVSRMVSGTSPLSEATRSRIRHVVSLSGLHDLRPIINMRANAEMRIDAAEAAVESPALLLPMDGARITCWVGGGERSEFIRQNALLANIWTGLGAETAVVEEPDRHHYSILEGLRDAAHPLTRTLLQA